MILSGSVFLMTFFHRLFSFLTIRQLVLECAEVAGCHRNHQRTCSPHVAFAYALEEEVEVEAFVGTAYAEAVLVAGQSVTDNLEVAVVVLGALAGIDNAVTVAVLELDVAGTVYESAKLHTCLVC